jgi:hypothetical protein
MTGNFASDYLAALRHHVETSDEAGLEHAHDLGRRALADGFGVLDVVGQHEAALRAIAQGSADDVRDAAQPFLLQSLAALDMATRGFVETAERLSIEQAHVAQLRRLADAFALADADVDAERRLERLVETTRQVLNASAFVHLSHEQARSGSMPTEVAAVAAAALSETGADAARGACGEAWPGHFWIAARLEVEPEAGADGRGFVVACKDAEFAPFDEAMLTQLANLASASLRSATLYERERNISITLQSSLLPKAPTWTAGLNIAAGYRPSGPAASGVGGDWFDVIELAGDSVALVMGDVMGHGIPAAAFMGQVSVAVRAYAVEGHTPATVLGRLDHLLSSGDELRLATIVYATIDGAGRLCFANAGHPPPLLVRPDGQPEYLRQALSQPIGVRIADRPHREHATTLSPGSTLVLYTDGLIERRGHSVDVGLDKLARIVTRNAPRPVQELCEATLAALAEPPSGDDACILAVHRPEVPSSDHRAV